MRRAQTVLTAPEKLKSYQLIIRCIHQRGDDQERCLKELGVRGLWLSDAQKAQAGLTGHDASAAS